MADTRSLKPIAVLDRQLELEVLRSLGCRVHVHWVEGASTESVSQEIRGWLELPQRESLSIPPVDKSMAHTSVTASAGADLPSTPSRVRSRVIGIGARIDLTASNQSIPESVGIDIESLDRPIRPEVIARVRAPSELDFGLKPIEEWVLKEASFKATSRLKIGAPLVLGNLSIQSWQPAKSQQDSHLKGLAQVGFPGTGMVSVAVFEYEIAHDGTCDAGLQRTGLPLLVAVAVYQVK